MALIQRGKIWHIRTQIKGILIAESTRTSNKRLAEQIEAQKVAELFNEVVVAGRRPITVKKAVAAFIEQRRGSSGYQSCQTKMLPWINAFGSKHLHEISAEDVRTHALNLVENEEYSINTVNVSIVYFNALQNFATAAGYTPGPKVKRLSGGTNRIRFLSDSEIELMRTELNPSNTHYKDKAKAQDNLDFFEFLLATGAREQEIASLTLTQVDQTKNTITIIRSKGGTNTTMKMSNKLMEILARRMVAAEQPLIEGQSLHGRTGNGFLFPERATGRTNNNWINQAAQRAKLEDVSCHVLRHTAAVRWLKHGLSIVEVQGLLGHRNISSTMCYMHIVPSTAADRAVEIQNKLDAIA